VAFAPELDGFDEVEGDRRAAEPGAALAGGGQTGAGAFADQLSFHHHADEARSPVR